MIGRGIVLEMKRGRDEKMRSLEGEMTGREKSDLACKSLAMIDLARSAHVRSGLVLNRHETNDRKRASPLVKSSARSRFPKSAYRVARANPPHAMR